MTNNLFDALRSGFPVDLDAVAIEVADGEQLRYSWRDIDRASAMMANLLASSALPPGGRVMARIDKSVEALMLWLAVLRAGGVLVPVDIDVGEDETARRIADAVPAVVVCRRRDFQWLSRLAFTAGTGHVFTLDDDRSGSLLERAAHRSDVQVPVAVDADAVAVVLAGDSGAGLSHAQLLAGACASGPAVPSMHALPLFTAQGLALAHVALLAAKTYVWRSEAVQSVD